MQHWSWNIDHRFQSIDRHTLESQSKILSRSPVAALWTFARLDTMRVSIDWWSRSRHLYGNLRAIHSSRGRCHSGSDELNILHRPLVEDRCGRSSLDSTVCWWLSFVERVHEDGGFESKQAIVNTIVSIVEENPEAKEIVKCEPSSSAKRSFLLGLGVTPLFKLIEGSEHISEEKREKKSGNDGK